MSLLKYVEGSIGKRAKDKIKDFMDKYNPRFLYVDFSGGKDSSAVLALVNDVTSKWIATFIHIAGQTHGINVESAYGVAKRLVHDIDIIKIVAKKKGLVLHGFRKILNEYTPPFMVHVITFSHSSGLDYWSAIEKHGFPAPTERMGRGKRWCCSEFKSEWLDERPPNGFFNGRLARFIAVGVKRSDSPYRRKLWANTHVKVFDRNVRYIDVALAPLIDYTNTEVFQVLLEYNIADIVSKQYEKWKRAPNCMLCPLMGKEALNIAVRNISPGLKKRVLEVLKKIRPRYKDDTFSAKKIDEWIKALEV